jgi:transposase
VYLRHTTRRKNGKTHTYWRLVRSVRIGRRVVQQTVATLGELDAHGRARAKAFAKHLGLGSDQGDLFEPRVPCEPVAVNLRKVRLERGRTFGAVWLAWTLWRALKLDELCERLMPKGREEIPWASMTAILAVAQLCEPSSELQIAENWYRSTALEDLLGVTADKVNDDRLYRALDQLLPHKTEIEKHLRGRFGEMFHVAYDLLLYDVTSTYFEGEAQDNELAKRGHSRDKRPDCKQVCIALVVTREGIPLGYEIFAGNRVDVTTVEEIVTAMEERHGAAERIWVMDRGMVSEENLEWLRGGKRRYLVGTPKGELRRFAAALVDKREWMEVREGLSVKLCPSPDGQETFVLCRSEERRLKESAMHERFSNRIRLRLDSLRRRVERARKAVDRGKVERQIGRLLGQNTRAANRFVVRVSERADRASGLDVEWIERQEWTEWAALSEGAYVLRTNVSEWTADELWRTYIQLTDAEAAFRTHKSDLSIRPVHHQTAARTRAHILVCFVAYAMWKTLEKWQQEAGLGRSPRKVMDELKQIQSTDVVLPTTDGRELRLRCVVRPNDAQADLLDRLGLDLPERLRVPNGIEV